MKVETGKSLLLFLILFVIWQVLFFLGLDGLLAYTVVLAVLLFFFALDRQSLASLGLRRSQGWKRYVGLGALLGILFVVCLSALGWILYRNDPESLTRPHIFSLNLGFLSVPYVATLALLVAFVEETSFRGYILRNLASAYSQRNALLFSAILFGLYHISIYYIYYSTLSASQTFTYWSSFILYDFVGGIIIGYLYLNTQRTITGPVALHSSIIFVQSFLPFEMSFLFAEGHLEITAVSLLLIPLLVLLKTKGYLGAEHPECQGASRLSRA